ncbi:MAG: nucleotide exchange factor GrpE, partial [Nitrospira sp.]|nr:nucleotide exchange factor GrpE [Nitrospira sp.]
MAEDQQNTNTIDDLNNAAQAIEEPGSVAALEQALADKAEEATGLNDKYLRLAAEFDNYKRLTQKDQRDQIRFGNEQLLKDLLPVIDNL